jgi:hypothetical protein
MAVHQLLLDMRIKENFLSSTRNLLFILAVFLFTTSVYAQLHHQSIGALGGSQVRSNYSISQTVGQSSVIGTSELTSTSVIQGYQHPMFNNYTVQSISNSEGIKFYPNPFSTQLNFEFQSEYNPIQITIIDILGRNVLTTTVQTSNKSILLDLPFLSDSKYVISLIGQNLNFQTKIIKKL